LPPEKEAKRVGDILPGVLQKLGLGKIFDESRLRNEWPEIVGAHMAARSRPGEVRNGVVFVLVDSSVWMQEIRFHQKQILERIKERLPGLGVKEIRLAIEREKGKG
jgi:predicted nucleic acid-binding Zn ribbon protein